MNLIYTSLISFLNGLFLLVSKILNPILIITLLLALSLFWISLIEIDELDRQGSKPEIGRH